MNNTTRLQLIDSDVKGFLEVKEGTKVPLNFSISDIRDISSRSGMFSKTITLAGTKNNNNLLNNYFDVNIVAGTFDVNKRQKVAIVQNGIILRDNCFMRLLKVKKKQSVGTNVDEWVEYEVQVTDELGDFFKEVGNKELKELDGWNEFKHIYGVDTVVDSFDHTVDDGYKYTLPWISNDQYTMNDLMPGVYAKQIFDRIHSMNGFSYDWATMTDEDTQFDKAILPYAGDKKKLTEEYIETVEVIAENSTSQYIGETLIGGQNNKYSSSLLEADTEVKDKANLYDPTTTEYLNTYTLLPPNKLNYEITFNWKVEMINHGTEQVRMGEDNVMNPPGNINETFTGARPRIGVKLGSNIIEYTELENPIFNTFSGMTGPDAPLNGEELGSVRQINGVDYLTTRGRVLLDGNETKELCSGSQTTILPITSISPNDILVAFKDISVRVGSPNPYYWFETASGQGAQVEYRFTISGLTLNIAPDSQNGLMPGTEIDLKNFLPTKMKQSEFLKTIYQKYNLYVEVDPDNPSKLIYTSRDKFYDDGTVKDWTEKLDKKRDQELYFIPDITTKRMILSYKDDDKDYLLSAYRGETSKTFGQVDAIFDNENVKGEERKEEVFSPTISMETEFGAVLPVLNADFKMNPRILQDGGKLQCQQYSLKESDNKTVHTTFYPHLSMFDKPYNPTFSTEYVQSSYYAYNPGLFTQNNLYTLHWRRTLAQINGGKMLKAWFWLTEEDIQGLSMNDKIKINNAYYYINAIIDYDANSNSVTKVELLTVEDDLKLPRVGGGIKDIGSIGEVVSGTIRPRVPSVPGGFFKEAISTVIKKRYDAIVVVTGPTPLTGNLGIGNTIPNGFRGVIIGDNLRPTEDGIFIDEVSVTNSGIFKEDSNGNRVGISLDDEGIQFTGEIDFSNAIVPGLGSMDITPITYTELKDLKTNNSLESGVRYYITDREIWIDALETDKLAMECKRHFRIIKDQFYTPHTDSANNYQGIYGQTIQRGSVPNSGTTVYFAIWGGRMWRRDTTGADVPGISDELIAGGWTMESPTNNTYYESKIFNIKYDFDEDIIWEQSDDRGNIIKRVYSVTSYIDITDWGNTSIFNNECYGIFNNFNNGDIYFNSNSGTIDNNSNSGFIASNTNQGSIYSNSNNGVINRNSNSNNISGNSNGGEIFNNSNNGTIVDNTNSGFIANNTNTNSIDSNTNNGFIAGNSNNGNIYYNSNNGDISVNTNSGSIDNNSNNGSINSNSNNGYIRRNRSDSGSTDIQYNRNNGLISRNRMNGTYLLEYNNNNGDIGDASNDITRNADITDTTVDK